MTTCLSFRLPLTQFPGLFGLPYIYIPRLYLCKFPILPLSQTLHVALDSFRVVTL